MKITLIALALTFAAVARANDYDFKEPFTRTGPFNATGEIVLSNINGDVAVRTWDKNEILIEGEKSAKTDEELKLIDLTIDLTDSHALIKVRLPRRPGGGFINGSIRAAVRFTLTVPATAVIRKIDTVNSAVTLDGLRGPVNASSVNGRIRANALGGDAQLHTVNGSIHANFAKIVADQKLSFETVNGSIAIALPKDAGAALHASVVNGHIDCDFPITLADGGKSHHSLSGTIGDGRASLSAESVNGSIHLGGL